MKINIYYGGRGLLDDPTLYVLNKMEEVLCELRVTVERINIFEHKNEIATLPQTMKEADGIILGSPVYTANLSANMQAFLERASVVTDMNRDAGLFRHKVGAAITAARRGGAVNALDAMNHFFLLQEMFVVGSCYWPLAYGQMPGDVEKDAEGLETMCVLGKNMAYLLKALKERS